MNVVIAGPKLSLSLKPTRASNGACENAERCVPMVPVVARGVPRACADDGVPVPRSALVLFQELACVCAALRMFYIFVVVSGTSAFFVVADSSPRGASRRF